MVPFAGWEMPVQYAGILAEANAVRRKGGIFDVSHMGRIYVSGPQATDLMEWIQTGRIGNLTERPRPLLSHLQRGWGDYGRHRLLPAGR